MSEAPDIASESQAGGLRGAYLQYVPAPMRRTVRAVRRRTARAGAWLTDPEARRMRERLESLRNVDPMQPGRRCFIMGNGPSLNKMDLDLLEGETVWGTNRCYLLFDRISWRPRCFVSVDRRVLPDIADDVQDVIADLPDTRFFFPYHFRRQGVIAPASNVFWYPERDIQSHRGPDGAFSLDATKGVFSSYTVTVAALQLATHMGYNPIYLIGCDTSYTVPSTVRADQEDPDRLTSTADDDANHFSPDYFGAGRKWHEPHVDRMIWHYRQAAEVCSRAGVSVVNATVGGQLEEFTRVEFESLFE
jgi:hypothetical protein